MSGGTAATSTAFANPLCAVAATVARHFSTPARGRKPSCVLSTQNVIDIHQDAFINRSRNQVHIIAGRKNAFKRREQSTLQVLANSMPLELRPKYDMESLVRNPVSINGTDNQKAGLPLGLG
jgi:hypothetical protein